MKKICTIFLLCGMSYQIISTAGGIEISPVPDYFTGLIAGLTGSFWDNSFRSQAEAQIVCNNIQPFLNGIDQNPAKSTAVLSNSCIIPQVKVTFTPDFPFPPSPDQARRLILIASVDNDGMEKAAGVGLQVNFGKVFFNPLFNYYLGLYGGAQLGSSADHMQTQLDNLALPDINFFNVIAMAEMLAIEFGTVSGELKTDVEMENIYDLGLQAGVLLSAKTMGYIKAGAAWSNIESATSLAIFAPQVNAIGFGPGLPNGAPIESDKLYGIINLSGQAKASINETPVGYEIGAGISYALNENILFSLEYVFRDFGEVSTGPGNIFIPSDILTKVTPDFFALINGTIIEDIQFSPTKDPLFYQVTQTSIRLRQSTVNAILAYRFSWLH